MNAQEKARLTKGRIHYDKRRRIIYSSIVCIFGVAYELLVLGACFTIFGTSMHVFVGTQIVIYMTLWQALFSVEARKPIQKWLRKERSQ